MLLHILVLIGTVSTVFEQFYDIDDIGNGIRLYEKRYSSSANCNGSFEHFYIETDECLQSDDVGIKIICHEVHEEPHCAVQQLGSSDIINVKTHEFYINETTGDVTYRLEIDPIDNGTALCQIKDLDVDVSIGGHSIQDSCYFDKNNNGEFWTETTSTVDCVRSIVAKIPWDVFINCSGVTDDMPTENLRVIAAKMETHLETTKIIGGFETEYHQTMDKYLLVTKPTGVDMNLTIDVSLAQHYVGYGVVGKRIYTPDGTTFKVDIDIAFLYPTDSIFDDLGIEFTEYSLGNPYPGSMVKQAREDKGSYWLQKFVLTIDAPNCFGFASQDFNLHFNLSNAEVESFDGDVEVVLHLGMVGVCSTYLNFLIGGELIDNRASPGGIINLLEPYPLRASFVANMDIQSITLTKLEFRRFSNLSVIRELVVGGVEQSAGTDMAISWSDLVFGIGVKSALFDIFFTFGLSGDLDTAFYDALADEGGRIVIYAKFDIEYHLLRRSSSGDEAANNADSDVFVSKLKFTFDEEEIEEHLEKMRRGEGDGGGDGGLSVGAILGIIFGVVFGVIVISVLALAVLVIVVVSVYGVGKFVKKNLVIRPGGSNEEGSRDNDVELVDLNEE